VNELPPPAARAVQVRAHVIRMASISTAVHEGIQGAYARS
jgi:hypothetical protein